MRTLPPDIKLHLQLGLLLALMLAGVAWLARAAGPGWAVVAGSLALAWGVERYQAIRREGVASYKDMAASAAPGLALGLAVELWRFL